MAIAEAARVRSVPRTRQGPGAESRVRIRHLLEELHAAHSVHLARIEGEVFKDSDPDDELVLQTQAFSRHWLLLEIEDALQRLADGAYGECEDCRGGIPWGRLETIPYARRCVTCQRSTRS
jgi:DnaK suppressor protein